MLHLVPSCSKLLKQDPAWHLAGQKPGQGHSWGGQLSTHVLPGLSDAAESHPPVAPTSGKP